MSLPGKRSKVPEAGVLRACLDLLAAEKIWWMRLNVGAVKIGDRFIKFAKSGTADILATPVIRYLADQRSYDELAVLWCECKSDTGRQSSAQLDFQKTVEAAGHEYLLVRSSDDLKNWLIEHGVIKP